MDCTREEYVRDRMERWRASAQCQCAAHVMEAMRQFGESWDSQKALDDWLETPEGQKWKAEFQEFAKSLQASVKS